METMAAMSLPERRTRQQALIAAIAGGRSVIEAAEKAGIGWRRAYVWRAEDAAFRAAWDKARAQVKARLRPAAAEIPVPPPPAEPPQPPDFVVPPSPPLPPLPPRSGEKRPQPPRIFIKQFDDDGNVVALVEARPERGAETGVADQS